ncbi:SH3 domain-containing protein [Streptomyces sp. NPDC046805]|uniref:SH3 domain-containing protein n=1 Tax=Streptomyces sp. NPDC046805 TaxID=3155134 RepID=UPI0033E00242
MNRRMRTALVAVAALAALTAPSTAVAADGGTSRPGPAAAASPHTLPGCKTPSSKTRHHRGKPVTHIHGRVFTPRHVALNIRSGPGTGYKVIGHKRSGSLIHLSRMTRGSNVRGNTRWYKLSDARGYVSAHYVLTSKAVPWR